MNDTAQVARKHAVHRWFVTCEWVTTRMTAAGPVRSPQSLVHAKCMGGMTTECGLMATSWVKLYELAFDDQISNACPDCEVAVDAAKLARRRRVFREV